ncbi:orotate phosphoribosyltransferase [Capnocytophaga sp. oral taxon 878]|uniref:orotate phosphoribosyltransferase n=1 Tax=Capnocytophaga sp. oral taxon 878 TaxID=1316596 RepID=UPI000D03029A|nr:orotate phosphoribosyltransferase [Capnocytophaga sp. oral taxon 878]AVM49465.1 orotate phosphoribosyltransferase [Capnocytophaga sp. oral taxon 878]
MVFDSTVAERTAEFLLQINAIKLNSQNYFTWASGWKSPIYCDNRIILSFPDVRSYFASVLVKGIKEKYPDVQVIAGVATGAIGIGMLVANALELPFVYVRPEPKKHGRQNQIEGLLAADQKVVVVEDLISTGMSSLNAVKALREYGSEVLGMIALFSYNFDIANERFAEEKVPLYTAGDYDSLLKKALLCGKIEKEELDTLQQWRKSPDTWG